MDNREIEMIKFSEPQKLKYCHIPAKGPKIRIDRALASIHHMLVNCERLDWQGLHLRLIYGED